MPIWRKAKTKSMPDSGYKDDMANNNNYSNNKTTPVLHDTAHVVSIVIDDDRKRVTDDAPDRRSRRELVKFLSPLYAILVVIIGFLFPLTEALDHKWLQTDYYAAFMAYILLLSMVLLVYFIVYLTRQSRRSHHKGSSKVKNETEQNRENESKNDEDAPSETRGDTQTDKNRDKVPRTAASGDEGIGNGRPVKRGTPNSWSASAANKLHTSRSCVNLSYTDPDSDVQEDRLPVSQATYTSRYNSAWRGSSGGAPAPGQLSHVSAYISSSTGDVRKPKPLNQFSETLMASMANLNVNNGGDNDGSEEGDGSTGWIDLTKLGNIFSHEGSNLYLRFATLMFGICNVVYVGLEIQNTMFEKSDCDNVVQFGWIFTMRLGFLVVQTFFLFKYPTVEIEENESIARFGLMHIIATNLCVWLNTLVLEIMNEFSHMESHDDSNDTSPPSSSSHAETGTSSPDSHPCDYFTGVLATLSPYLFPFVLEYSLIVMGTLATMYVSIVEGSNESDSIARGLHNLFKVRVPTRHHGPTDAESSGGGGEHGEDAVLRKSHRGLFLGVLVLSGAVVAIVMFYGVTDTISKDLTFLSTDLTIHILLTVATIFALVHTNRLSYIAKPLMVDDVLLIISMSGAFLYEVSYVMATSSYIQDHPSGKDETVEIMQLCSSLVSLVQTVLQVVLVASALRRYPSKREHLDEMPGRGSITFLIVVNVVVWICRTMQAKQVAQDTEIGYYGEITWLLLINVNLPLLLFFRYHSSICLADIWHIAYYPVDAKLQHNNVQKFGGGGERPGASTPKGTPSHVRKTARDHPPPMIMVTGISHASSMTRLDLPEANGFGGTTRQKPNGFKMLEGIDIIPEDGVSYDETIYGDEEEDAIRSAL